jgi:hypothetical protein
MVELEELEQMVELEELGQMVELGELEQIPILGFELRMILMKVMYIATWVVDFQ